MGMFIRSRAGGRWRGGGVSFSPFRRTMRASKILLTFTFSRPEVGYPHS